MTPQVTIVIATYNAAGTLRAALDSVVSQKFDDWECVVVDGASTDGTLEIVAEYAARDPRIRCISEPDRGIYDAFNKGWRAARGRWIHYLGADDRLLPEGIASLLAQAGDADVVYGGVELRFDVGTDHPQGNKPPHTIPRFMPACHQAFLMKRKAIDAVDGFNLDYPVVADFDLVQRIYKTGLYKFSALDVLVCSFKVGGASSKIKIYREIYRVVKTNGLYPYPELYIGFQTARAALVRVKWFAQKVFLKHK